MTYKYNNVYIKDSYTIAGMYESDGPLKKYFDKVVVKVDKDGCIGIDGDKEFFVPSIDEFKNVDSTGAGDAFLAGFVYGLFYDKPLDEKGEKYETYFLNLVDSRDLLDIIDAKDIPDEPEVIYVTPEPTAVPTQSPSSEEKADVQKPDSSKTMLGLAVIAVLAGGGALWYFKQKKGKKRPPVQDYDFDNDEKEEPDKKDE